MVRKIYIYTIILFTFLFAKSVFANTIDDVLTSANPEFSSAVVSISVKDLNSGRILYQKNPDTLVHPASTLKIITGSAVLDYLGTDYQFKTSIYKNGDKIYFKVGADPLFTYQDMSDLISQYARRNSDIIKNFIIDDSIIDKKSFGIGWQWDDNADIHFSQMSPYIINKNLFMLKAKLTSRNQVVIEKTQEYSEPVKNNLSYSDAFNVTISRNIFNSPSDVVLNGYINKETIFYIPALNPHILYGNVMIYNFLKHEIPINTKFKYDKLPRFCALEAEIAHPITQVITQINQNSNNLAAEILLKHAGYIKTELQGTTKDGLDIVLNYYKNHGLDTDKIRIVDASGVSMNDYVSANFMTEALKVISKSQNFNIIKNSMATPSNGTFENRLKNLDGKLFVKTGTLANTSAVVGYLKTNSGKDITFAIMIDNVSSVKEAKNVENKIIAAISNL